MEKREHHFVHQLSGGEMQRTAIARALVHRPKVLLADEPTGNLDAANADKVLEIFRRIVDERLTTLVVVTHSTEVAETAERRIHLRNGKVAEWVSAVGVGVQRWRLASRRKSRLLLISLLPNERPRLTAHVRRANAER